MKTNEKKSFYKRYLLVSYSQSVAQKNGQQLPMSLYYYKNQGRQTLAYLTNSGIKVLTINDFAFKDLNKNGKLDTYEDLSLPLDVYTKDLATKLSIEQIAGLKPI